MSEETLYTWQPCQHAGARPATGVARARWDKDKPSPNPDDAGPIVLRRMGLPVTAGCDTAWDQTWVCSDASSTAMQYLRPLRPTGGNYDILHGKMLIFFSNDLRKYADERKSLLTYGLIEPYYAVNVQ